MNECHWTDLQFSELRRPWSDPLAKCLGGRVVIAPNLRSQGPGFIGGGIQLMTKTLHCSLSPSQHLTMTNTLERDFNP